MKIDITLVLLLIAAIANGVLLTSILKSKSKKQIKKIFSFNLICLLICTIGQITQIFCVYRNLFFTNKCIFYRTFF